MYKIRPSKEVKTASFEGRFVLLDPFFVQIAIALLFCNRPSIETTLSIESSAACARLSGTLASGLYKNCDTCSQFLWKLRLAAISYLMRDMHFNAAQRRNAVSRTTACGVKDFFDGLKGAAPKSRSFSAY